MQQDDKQHGKGKYEMAEGIEYEGCYKNGRKDGIGMMILKDGKLAESSASSLDSHGGCRETPTSGMDRRKTVADLGA